MFTAAYLAQRWVGLTFMSYGDRCSKTSTVMVWMRMYTLYIVIVWMYIFTKIQKIKRHPWHIRQNPFLPHKLHHGYLHCGHIWEVQASAHSAGFCKNAEVKVAYFTGAIVPQKSHYHVAKRNSYIFVISACKCWQPCEQPVEDLPTEAHYSDAELLKTMGRKQDLPALSVLSPNMSLSGKSVDSIESEIGCDRPLAP